MAKAVLGRALRLSDGGARDAVESEEHGVDGGHFGLGERRIWVWTGSEMELRA